MKGRRATPEARRGRRRGCVQRAAADLTAGRDRNQALICAGAAGTAPGRPPPPSGRPVLDLAVDLALTCAPGRVRSGLARLPRAMADRA